MEHVFMYGFAFKMDWPLFQLLKVVPYAQNFFLMRKAEISEECMRSLSILSWVCLTKVTAKVRKTSYF